MNVKREMLAAIGMGILLAALWRSRKHFKQPAIRNTHTTLWNHFRGQ